MTFDPAAFDRLYHSGAYLCLVVIVAYHLLAWTCKNVAWLQTGKRHAVAAGAIGFLTAIVVPAAQGTTPSLNALIFAIGTGYAFYADPTKLAKLLGTATIIALLLIAPIACTAQQIAGAKSFGKCEETAAVKDLTDTVKHILEAGVATWQQQLDALAAAYGKDTLICAVTSAEQAFEAKQGGDSASPAAAERARSYLASAK